MRDILPSDGSFASAPGDRSIRNIPIPAGHRHVPEQPVVLEHMPPEPPARAPRPRRKRRAGRFLLWALAVIIVCAGAVAGISMLYAGAAVAVHPRIEDISTASTTLAAQVNAPVGVLSYAVLVATDSATTTVPATGTKKVSRQATGVVTLSSTYSASQRLISGTRLAAPDGKIYRLASSVDLPANGSVVATVNAESPGDTYNRSSATTFTLPGFAGDPRFTKFSAKSQGAITGGFVGDEPAVADADLEAARAELKAKLDNSTQRQLGQNIPTTSTPIPGTLAMTYGDLVQAASTDKKTATISQSAT
ncbi:MAG TPA: hypothetical protein VGP13_01315, partial [Candidatus Paceibacterota bacterium]|nr:hypothetical protein [Candidatus Paceibacterota bacterium]